MLMLCPLLNLEGGWVSVALCLTWTKSPLIFTPRYYGDSSWHSRLGSLVWGWRPLLVRGTSEAQMCSSRFSTATVGVGSARSPPPPLLLVSVWLFLHTLSCRVPVQLVPRWLSRVVVL